MTSFRVCSAQLGLGGASKNFALRGCLPPAPRLAVVGSRGAHRRDQKDVHALVALAKARRTSVISGGALGVDAWMHREALRLDLPQLVVLPCAIGSAYPPDHGPLFEEIVATGHSGVLYTLEPNMPQPRFVFVARNRIVVGASQALVVVQAQRRSGSIWTGKRALAAKKRVAVFAGTPGTQELQSLGATCLGSSDEPARVEVIEAWLDGRPDPRACAWPAHLHSLRAALGPRPRSLDELSDPIFAALWVQEALALGLVFEPSPGLYALTARGQGSAGNTGGCEDKA